MRSQLYTPNCECQKINLKKLSRGHLVHALDPKQDQHSLLILERCSSALFLKNTTGQRQQNLFKTVDSTVKLPSDKQNQFASALQENLVSCKTCYVPTFTLPLLKLKISISSKFLHITVFLKALNIFVVLFLPHSNQSAAFWKCHVQMRYSTPIKALQSGRLFHTFCYKSTRTLFYGNCLVHNSKTLLTRVWLLIHHNDYTIFAILPSYSCISEAVMYSSFSFVFYSYSVHPVGGSTSHFAFTLHVCQPCFLFEHVGH